MKTRKNIRDAFKYNGGGSSLADELQTAEITDITNYPNNINDIIIYYNNPEPRTMSFTDGETVITTTTTTVAPTTTTTTTVAPPTTTTTTTTT